MHTIDCPFSNIQSFPRWPHTIHIFHTSPICQVFVLHIAAMTLIGYTSWEKRTCSEDAGVAGVPVGHFVHLTSEARSIGGVGVKLPNPGD